MTIRRRCSERKCKDGRRCLKHLVLDVMFRGKRHRIPANEFAIPRMEPGRQRPIQSMEEARDWERRFIGEIKAGRDPRRPTSRAMQAGAELANVSAFLDAYMDRLVKPSGLRSIATVRSQISVLKQHLGDLPLQSLEDPDEINRFKTSSDYAEDVEIASVHRVLERLRAAINWGLAQTPPLFDRSPFHRFGVRLDKKSETIRDRRVSRDEERRLLEAALGVMNTARHQYVGETLHDRIIGALELCCRRGEMLLIQNKRVNWDTCQIGIPGATAKDKENRRVPFNPKGRVAAVLKRRATLGPDAFVFGHPSGTYQPLIQTAWETLKLLANGLEPRLGIEGTRWNQEQLRHIDLRWHDLRHEGACRLLTDGRRHPHRPADAGAREHPTDAALPQRDRRGVAKGPGSELGTAGPAAEADVGALTSGCPTAARLSPICPRRVWKLAPRAGFEPATLRLTAGCSAVELPRNSGPPPAGAGAGAARSAAHARLTANRNRSGNRPHGQSPRGPRASCHPPRPGRSRHAARQAGPGADTVHPAWREQNAWLAVPETHVRVGWLRSGASVFTAPPGATTPDGAREASC